MNTPLDDSLYVWKFSPAYWLLLAFSLILCAIIFSAGIADMEKIWAGSEEYGYGYLIPVISAFLIWQKKDQLEIIPFNRSMPGVYITLIGAAVFFLGHFSAIFAIIGYGLVITLFGIAFSVVGTEGIKKIWVPFIFLFFMIPLPQFIYQSLSSALQLLSSEIGVMVIRAFGISVYLEGNVIDLGSFKLQVVEACSGLRYLFPLMSLTFISVYFFQAKLWVRSIIFLSSVPITILMNSARIGIIGILVDYGGPEQAEGFLHFFEGWIIFMVCLGLIVSEMWLFTRFTENSKSFSEVFGIDFPEPTPENSKNKLRKVPVSMIATVCILTVTLLTTTLIDARTPILLDRSTFAKFPLNINKWVGKKDSLEAEILDVLKLDDYILSRYVNDVNESVYFYVAYYKSQIAGGSAHSPRACIPGGGWEIESLTQKKFAGISKSDRDFEVNRLMIRKGDHIRLVYYWFQQRNRNITSEYLVKWFLFWDSLTINRTDGALIRLSTVVFPHEKLSDGDKRLTKFMSDIQPLLSQYIPE